MSRAFYGAPLPGVDPSELHGALVVVEGGDGSGRSTQIRILRDWLESRGHMVVDVGLKRSTLVSAQLEQAQQGNILGRTTMALFYATDFADQLENVIIPALRAGYVVVADRYIYTLMVRAIVRGSDPEWVRSIYGLAPVPDAVFYLRVSARSLVERTFQKRSALDHWESGMDLGLKNNIFDSFMEYQRRVRREFMRMRNEYGFEVVNGNRTVRTVSRALQARIEEILRRKGMG